MAGNVKVKANHTIVHDGQTLKPGTIFEADDKLVKDLEAAGAITKVEDTDTVPVKLKPVHKDPASAATIAADKRALLTAQQQLAADSGDGLDTVK